MDIYTDNEIINIVELKSIVQKSKIRLWVENGKINYTAPKDAMTNEIKQALKHHKAQLLIDLSVDFSADMAAKLAAGYIPEVVPELIATPNERYSPFPMTELQQAYWVGEQGAYAQSCKPCFFHHVKFELLTLEKLSQAIYYLQHKHEVLRSRFFADGTQVIAKPGDNLCQPLFTDLREVEKNSALEKVTILANSAPDALPDLNQGPPLSAHLVRLKDEDHLLFSIRLNVIDGPSLKIIFKDLLSTLFSSHEMTTQPITPNNLSFRDYAILINQYKSANSIKFWEKTLPTLPSAPELPTTSLSPKTSSFKRLQGKLDAEKWQLLKDNASYFEVSINAVLFALFSATLRPWSKNKNFCINMLLNYRPFHHPEMASLTGNCTNNTLIDCLPSTSFLQQVKQLQEQLAIKIEHASVSGVSLLRQLQQQNNSDKPAVPFVFTSGVSADTSSAKFTHANKVNIISNHLQTPQVWLDHQVVQNNDELLYFWDYVEDIFLPGIPQAMFEYYEKCLHALLKQDAWQQLPATMTSQVLPSIKQSTTDSTFPLADHLPYNLPELLYQRAKVSPDAIAFESDQSKLTYQELLLQAQKAAGYLQHHGVTTHSLVAIQIAKSEVQMITIIAISLCGATWLPLDIRSPYTRREKILQHSQCHLLVSDLITNNDADSYAQIMNTKELIAAQKTNTFSPVEINVTDIAYIIYTSGSTGQPKGVVTSHGAVLNTIHAVNHQFKINKNDKVLALSASSFDLSIYDLWGSIAAGATLVIPVDTEYPDPLQLINYCQKYQITVWNSVPALLDMVLSIDMDKSSTLTAFKRLRIIMLSGDWISLKLASTLLQLFPTVNIYSLGGATEASIWSNYFPIKKIDPKWKSIPYGFPLHGQQLHILNETQNICPTGVTGEIYIAGKGLANGYLNDKEKTEKSFVIHHTGERLYATGDLGRYRDNVGIEFLGRKDFQLKIRGYRIESAEIELQLESINGISSSCVFSVNHNNNQYLVACYTGQEQDEIVMKKRLLTHLPRYMQPDLYLHQSHLPLNNNGKIDRSQLQAMTLSVLKHTLSNISDSSPISSPSSHDPLLSIWGNVVGHKPAIEENFFQHGGNSLLAVQLLNGIKAQYSVDISLADIFNKPTFIALLQLIQDKKNA